MPTLSVSALNMIFMKLHIELNMRRGRTSRPAKGDVLTENDILTVGSSTVIVGRATPSILSANVSPIYATLSQTKSLGPIRMTSCVYVCMC